MHIAFHAFYAISTVAGLTREAGWKLLCAKAGDWFLLPPRAVCLSILLCSALISHNFGALITSQASLGFWKHIFYPEWDKKPWNRTDLWSAKLLTQQGKKQTKERKIFSKGCRNKVSIATLLFGTKKKKSQSHQIYKMLVICISLIGHPTTQNWDSNIVEYLQ